MESRREAQVLLQEAQKQKQGSMTGKTPLGPQGQWDGEPSCRMASMSAGKTGKSPSFRTHKGPSQMGRLCPCQAPASLRQVHKGARWGANLGHSLCWPHSFLAKDWNGVERPGLGCPVLVVLAKSLSQASAHRSTGPSGTGASCGLAKLLLGLQPAHGGHQDNAASTPVFSLWNYG